MVDASGLLAARSNLGVNAVLNGIAHAPLSGHFLLTGKSWPVMFEVVLESASDQLSN